MSDSIDDLKKALAGSTHRLANLGNDLATLKTDMAAGKLAKASSSGTSRATTVQTAGNNPRGTAPEALTSLIEQTPGISPGLRDAIVGFVVCERLAESKGQKLDMRISMLAGRRDEITALAATALVFAAQVAHDSSLEAIRDKAQGNVMQEKVAKLHRENADLETQIEDTEARIAKAEGKPAPAGSSVLDAIKKAHKTPQRITPANW